MVKSWHNKPKAKAKSKAKRKQSKKVRMMASKKRTRVVSDDELSVSFSDAEMSAERQQENKDSHAKEDVDAIDESPYASEDDLELDFADNESDE